MTNNKDFKKRVRARMAKTGESYTTARMNILKQQEPPPSPYAPEELANEALRPWGADDPETRVIQEPSGRWVARIDDYPPEFVGYGEDPDEARAALQRVIDAESDWRNAIVDSDFFLYDGD